MSRWNTVPVNVQQLVESVKDKSVSENVKFNQIQVLEAIRDYADSAVKFYYKNKR